MKRPMLHPILLVGEELTVLVLAPAATVTLIRLHDLKIAVSVASAGVMLNEMTAAVDDEAPLHPLKA